MQDAPPQRADLQAALRDALLESNPASTTHLLRHLIGRAWKLDPVVAVRASQELAALGETAVQRSQARGTNLRRAFDRLDAHPDHHLAVATADLAVDQFYDQFAGVKPSDKQGALAKAKRALDAVIPKEPPDDDSAGARVAIAFGQLSSVLRCQAYAQGLKHPLQRAGSALRAAHRAVDLAPSSPLAHLAVAQSALVAARFETDEGLLPMIRKAEDELAIARTHRNSIAALVASQHFRSRFRPLQSVEAFLEFETLESNRRRVLRESYLIGEAAVHLFQNQYHVDTVRSALDAADRLLTEALRCGYRDARMCIAHASVQAAKGNTERSHDLIAQLSRITLGDWTTVLRTASQLKKDGDLRRLTAEFLLGVDDSHTWNSLGSYAMAFGGERDLAIECYRHAIARQARNVVALTNLARLLATDPDPSARAEARSHILAARSHADQLFTWWRPVAESLEMEAQTRLDDAFRALQSPVQGTDPHEAFLALCQQLKKESLLPPCIVDAHYGPQPADAPTIAAFLARVVRTERAGIFISMAGYTASAIDTGRRLPQPHKAVFLNAADARAVFAGQRIEQLLDRRLDRLARLGDPFEPDAS